MPRFCARCGAPEAPDRPIIAGLCPRCYVEVRRPVEISQRVEITYCPRCYSIRVRGRWLPVSSYEEFMERAKELIRSGIRARDPNAKLLSVDVSMEFDEPRARVTVALLLGGRAVVSIEREVAVSWRRRLCPMCFRRAGGTFEAVVQVRFFNYDERVVEKLKSIALSSEFANDVVELEENRWGFDVKVGSSFVAKRLAEVLRRSVDLPSKLVESFGDVRRSRDGRRRGRLYISLRFINLRRGDYLVYRGRAYTVDSVSRHGVVLEDSSGRRMRVSYAELIEGFRK
ncbi:MAG: hypothetical protein DRO39_05125 [Thermoprotei archaeon]|nr:MAG: hypothetical protein DRO39_05125 [Thermoprotei archaeon]